MSGKSTAHVTMRVRIGENELEVTGPSEYVDKKIAEFVLTNQKKIVSSNEPPPRESKQPSSKKTSPAQFFKKLSPGTDVDRTLAAGYYCEKYKNMENFTAADIRETIRETKRVPPKNPNDAVSKNIRKGLMMSAGDKDGKKAYVLTSDGVEEIENVGN